MTISSLSFKSEQSTQTQKQKPVRSFGGALGALAVGGMIHQSAAIVSEECTRNFISELSFKDSDAVDIKKAANQILEDTGLKARGARIKYLNPIREKSRTKMSFKDFINKFDNGRFFKHFMNILYVTPVRKGENALAAIGDVLVPKEKMQVLEYLKDTKLGDQKLSEKAVYIKKNSILVPKYKNQGAVFHEIGHLLNANYSKFARFLQKHKAFSMISPLIFATYSAFTKKSAPKEENGDLTVLQKTNNFIRNNAGKLTFLTFLPTLIEEGMASIKGQKYAKKLLKPEAFKKICKGNLLAYGTYLAGAIMASLGVACVVDVKNNAIENKREKMEQRSNG